MRTSLDLLCIKNAKYADIILNSQISIYIYVLYAMKYYVVINVKIKTLMINN